MKLDTTIIDKENNVPNSSGTVFHDGFKFHRKYKGKKSTTYWCCNNRDKSSECTAKIKVDFYGEVFDIQGSHDNSCHYKQVSTRKALGFLNPVKNNDLNCHQEIDVTDKMLARAAEIATKDLSLPPRKIHEMILKEIKREYRFFKGASDQKIINKIRNSRTYLNGNDVFRTIESDIVAKVKNSNFFFYISMQLSRTSTMENSNE